MLTFRARLLSFVLILLVILAGGVVGFRATSVRVHAAEADGSKLKALLNEKLDALREVAAQTTDAYQNGQAAVSFSHVREANQAVYHAELKMCDSNTERIAVLEKMVADAREYETFALAQAKLGAGSMAAELKAKVSRLEAEIALERAKNQ